MRHDAEPTAHAHAPTAQHHSYVLTRHNVLPILLRRAQLMMITQQQSQQTQRPAYFEVLRAVLEAHPDWALDPECVLDEGLCERYARLWLLLKMKHA